MKYNLININAPMSYKTDDMNSFKDSLDETRSDLTLKWLCRLCKRSGRKEGFVYPTIWYE